ncbi:MAG: excinuclease ABC subunit UvrC [Candidatus Saganbacteria bacterium]|nr:excinuclease ABC subunit UvrC [Candidatus Saganbacteria bacterium]
MILDRKQLKDVPHKPGVYIFYDRQSPIYVGKASDLRNRLSSYFNLTELPIKTVRMLEAACRFEINETQTELEALLLENDLIKKHQPRYNVSLKDDKRYPFLKLTKQEAWPRLLVVRKKLDDGARYFGPYRSETVKQILRFIKRLFPIRWCKETPLRKRKQPCLYFAMKKCTAPCVGRGTRDFYLLLCEGIAAFLGGNVEETLLKLRREMSKASSAGRFEDAGELRDIISALEKVLIKENRVLFKTETESILDQGEVLTQLQKDLSLKSIPKRIEAFDISNLSGTNTVASMVVFEDGKPLKADYRRFKIRGVKGPNDVASMQEVIGRRYAGSLAGKLKLPDLILVDGGKGQARAAFGVLRGMGILIPVFGLAKKEEQIHSPQIGSKPIILSQHAASLKLLQRLRDEAHRFAVFYHRKRRGKLFLEKTP